MLKTVQGDWNVSDKATDLKILFGIVSKDQMIAFYYAG